MKKLIKFLSILLLIAGVCAVCYGCVELISYIEDTRRTTQGSNIISGDNRQDDTTSTNGNSGAASTEFSTESSSLSDTTEVSAEELLPKASATEVSATETVAAEEYESYVSPYAEFFEAYPDCVAWFSIPDTNISYPVMWTPGDEEYYLYRNYDGTDNINGSLLLDTDSSLSPLTTNLIIHGHNMRSGAMFGNLPNYENKAYYEQHKEMLLFTADCERRYEIIAVFRSQVFKKSDTVFKYYKFFQADTEEEFNDFYSNIIEMSIYDTGVTAEFGDHFITLSTCVSHVENGRFVVIAKEVTDSTIQK